jgi:hypothetical protein
MMMMNIIRRCHPTRKTTKFEEMMTTMSYVHGRCLPRGSTQDEKKDITP